MAVPLRDSEGPPHRYDQRHPPGVKAREGGPPSTQAPGFCRAQGPAGRSDRQRTPAARACPALDPWAGIPETAPGPGSRVAQCQARVTQLQT